jgi:MYXO-CTERM domain-containing protein
MRKPARTLPLALAALAVPIALAAGGCEPPRQELRGKAVLREAREPIVGGQPAGNQYRAAMAMTVDTGDGLYPVCSGTMIAVNGNFGYVLTAAHCGQIDYVLETDEYSNCDDGGSDCRFYEVVDSQIHPDYNGNTEEGVVWDFQMIRVTGVDGNTPVVPAASDDNIDEGDDLVFAGYGQINQGGGLGDSSGRRFATNTVDFLDGLQIFYSQSYTVGNGGVCFGDSGGPTFGSENGPLEVVGVNRAVTSDFCDDFGISARVQAVFGSFIAPFMGEDPGPLECDPCVDIAINTKGGACRSYVDTCFATPDCANLNDCLIECGSSVSCQNGCVDQYQDGLDEFNAIFDCAYCEACAAECADDQDFCDDPSCDGNGDGDGDGDEASGEGSGEDGGCSVGLAGASAPSTGIWLLVAGAAIAARRRRIDGGRAS